MRRLSSAAALAVATLAGGLLVGCSGSSDNSTVTIAKTSQNGLQLLLVDIAQRKGFFAKHGVHTKIKSLNGDAASIPALVSGSVQFAVSTSTPFFTAAKRSPIKLVAPLTAEPPSQIVVSPQAAAKAHLSAKAPLDQRVKALKGMRVAFLDIGGGSQYTFNVLLSQHGLSAHDVSEVAVAPYTSMLSALKRGTVDVAVASIPYGTIAVDRDGATMAADVWNAQVPSITDLDYEVLAVQPSWAKSHPKTVTQVRQGITDAMRYVRANPDGAVQVAHQLLPSISVKILKEALSNPDAFPASTTITHAEYKTMVEFARRSGVTATVSYDKAWY